VSAVVTANSAPVSERLFPYDVPHWTVMWLAISIVQTPSQSVDHPITIWIVQVKVTYLNLLVE